MRKVYGRRDPMDRFFSIFPYIFMVVFALVAITVIVQFTIIGVMGYNFLTDPEGSAKYMGEIAGEAIRPVINVIEENR